MAKARKEIGREGGGKVKQGKRMSAFQEISQVEEIESTSTRAIENAGEELAWHCGGKTNLDFLLEVDDNSAHLDGSACKRHEHTLKIVNEYFPTVQKIENEGESELKTTIVPYREGSPLLSLVINKTEAMFDAIDRINVPQRIPLGYVPEPESGSRTSMIAMAIEKDTKQEQVQHSDESLADVSMASKCQQQPTTLRLQDQSFFIVG